MKKKNPETKSKTPELKTNSPELKTKILESMSEIKESHKCDEKVKESSTPRFIKTLPSYRVEDEKSRDEAMTSTRSKASEDKKDKSTNPIKKSPLFDIHDCIDDDNSIIHSILTALLSKYTSASTANKIDIVKQYRIEMANNLSQERFKKMKIYPTFISWNQNTDLIGDFCPSVLGILPSLCHIDDIPLFEESLYQLYVNYLKKYENPVGEEILELIVDTFDIRVVIFDNPEIVFRSGTSSSFVPQKIYTTKDYKLSILLLRTNERGKIVYNPMGRDKNKYFYRGTIEF